MKKGLLFITVLMAFILYACSGGGGGSSTPGGGNIQGVHLTGKISGLVGSSSLTLSRAIAQAQGVPDHVWAIPIAKIQGANVDPINVYLRQSQAFSSDGSFSFDLPKSITAEELKNRFPDIELPPDTPDSFELDWLLVTVDTSTNPVTVLDMIQLTGSSAYDALMLLPISSFTADSYDLGVITNGDSEKTTDTIETVSTVTGDSLKVLSRADNIMRSLKNVIQNCDINNNKCYDARQSFVFTGNYTVIGSDYDRAQNYSGYQFYFDLNDYYGPSDFDGICPGSGTPTVTYTLTPPADILINSTTYGPNNPLTTGSDPGLQEWRGSDEMVCSQGKDNTFLWKKKDSTGQWKEWGLQFITGDKPSQLTTDMPPGTWSLKRNGSEIAKFEFILANPVDSNGNPLVFVPAIRLTLNPDGQITTVEVKWYRWDNSAGTYQEITGDDLGILDDLAGGFELAFGDFDGITGDPSQRYVNWFNLSFKNNTSINVGTPQDGKGPFYYNYSDNDKYSAQYIGIYYQFGGQGFRFAWAMYI